MFWNFCDVCVSGEWEDQMVSEIWSHWDNLASYWSDGVGVLKPGGGGGVGG
jgi:hypothetical protein